MTLPVLTGPEQLVWDAFPSGTWVDLRAGDPREDSLDRAWRWGPGRAVRAEVLRALLLGARDAEPGFAPGIRLRGAYVVGRLDLMGASVNWPLVCEHCVFGGEIRLVESSTRTVRIVHSVVPGFNGTRMRLDGILNLWGCAVAGVVRLDQAKVTGQVCLRTMDVGASAAGTEAVAAAGIAVDGGLECTGLKAHGTVSIQVARISGSVDLSGAEIVSPGGKALVADYAEIGGRLDCRAMVLDGQTSLHNSRVAASVTFSGSKLENPAAWALSAGGVTIDGGVFLDRGFSAQGEVRLVGARLGANLTLSGSTFRNPGAVAVNLDRATVGVCHGDDLTCAGRFSFVGARIASGLELERAQLDAGAGNLALAGDGSAMEGALMLTGIRARGEVSLRSARIGRTVLMKGAVLENKDEIALRMSGADVAGDVVCGEISVTGAMRLTGARVGGRLSLDRARLANPGRIALSARSLLAGQLSLRPGQPVEGTVDLRHARIEVLRDDPGCWPAELSLDGLTYQALEPRLPARDRLRWLARDPSGLQSQPYEHLAAHYDGLGRPAEARAVLHARERIERRTAMPAARVWGVVQDFTLGYGYRPWRALAWLALLLAAGSIIFDLYPPPPLQPGAAPHFNPIVYTLDLLLPLVDLGQKHAFNPAGALQWFSYVLVASGWIFVTTIAAAAARVLRR